MFTSKLSIFRVYTIHWLIRCFDCNRTRSGLGLGFRVGILLKGYGKVGFHLDSRLPFTLHILDRLVAAASSLVGSAYQITQFQAMGSLAFLRIGEITSVSKQGAPLQLSSSLNC